MAGRFEILGSPEGYHFQLTDAAGDVLAVSGKIFIPSGSGRSHRQGPGECRRRADRRPGPTFRHRTARPTCHSRQRPRTPCWPFKKKGVLGDATANILFCRFPQLLHRRTPRRPGSDFYDDRWEPGIARFVTTFAHTETDIDTLLAAIRERVWYAISSRSGRPRTHVGLHPPGPRVGLDGPGAALFRPDNGAAPLQAPCRLARQRFPRARTGHGGPTSPRGFGPAAAATAPPALASHHRPDCHRLVLRLWPRFLANKAGGDYRINPLVDSNFFFLRLSSVRLLIWRSMPDTG